VLAPGGALVAAFLCRFAAARYWAHERPEASARELPRELAILDTGVLVTGGADPAAGGWVDAYAERPEAIRPFMEAGGFATLDLVGAEGICDHAQEKTAAIPEALWPAYVELNLRLGREPSLLGASSHLLYVGRKR
jgi:S-adenosylmethionine-dependent methyltransferase